MGTTSITVFSGGILSVPTLTLMTLFITSLPMIVLLHLDRRGLKKQGLAPPSTFWTYFFAVVLPSYFMTIAYLVFRPTSNTEELTNSEEASHNVSSENSIGEAVISNYVDELPPLSATNWDQIDLKNLSATTYSDNISEMIRLDMEDDNLEFTTYEAENGMPVFCSNDGELVALPIRLNVDRVDSVEEGIRVAQQLSERFDTYIVTAYTDSHIEDSVCVDLIDRCGVFLVPEEITRRTLELHSISPP